MGRAKLPLSFVTNHLDIRAAHPDYTTQVYEAIQESLADLQPWMIWATPAPTERKVEAYLLEAWRRFEAAEEFPLLYFCREREKLLGGSGLHQLDWHVPKCEIGYWCRSSETGKGFVTGVVAEVLSRAHTDLGMIRVEIRASELNVRSQRVPERLGFTKEAVLRQDRREISGKVSNTVVYARCF